MASSQIPAPSALTSDGAEKVHLLSRVMRAAQGRRIVLVVDEVGFGHRLVIENSGDSSLGPAEQCEANR